MKPKPRFEPHLVLQEVVLAPGCELGSLAMGWYAVQVAAGAGYWLHPRENLELTSECVLVFCHTTRGIIRASQVGELTIQLFRVQAERLTGVVSFGEQQFLQSAAGQEQLGARFYPSTSEIADKFRELVERGPEGGLPTRLLMLDLFVRSFGADWQRHTHSPLATNDAKTRLMKFLKDTPPAELLDLSFAELVRETRCTPRHLNRLFHQVVGMSFREKQAQVRLLRAQELLATTETKVVEVALESGYPSPCLFNLMFKRRFGVTPAKWRDQSRKVRPANRTKIRPAMLGA